MNNNQIKRLFIPGGLTRKLQPLDIAINKPFKDHLKKCYTKYQLENSGNTITNKQAKIERKKKQNGYMKFGKTKQRVE